ncbi:aminopeptidase [Bacillus sp. FJAT-42376]|uniref:aminopeptidase n=1 Tax=Bacillus sp. FJAT-42376 TaxID=2014076 RepID=UPI000F4FBDDE|nr:aminopeptidase [Bacillus sp. FJAT-42376]AZB42663.1 aminopeptidase [Bacillus sp. FJAT-42376]
MSDFQKNLEKYADLVVKVGVNIQKGQTLVVHAAIDTAAFTRLIVKKAYETGAKNVIVDWMDDTVSRLKYDLAPDEVFEEYPMHRAKERIELAEKNAAFISIVSANPDLLKGVDSKRISAANKAAGQALDRYRQYVQSDKMSWCVIAAPSADWALKVFPDSSETEAVEKLWDAIFKAVRVYEEDPVQAWIEHNASLHKKVDYLNSKKYKALHYKAKGTDLTIELHEKHQWVGAGSVNEQGAEFMANMPTEEVFTVPVKTGVNGVVSSTKPLSYAGNLIDEFQITFENGKIVKAEAKTGEEILNTLIDTDEGSHYLGEVALVPYDSPISKSGVLFYNTLFDENASNHLAIGSGYAFNIEGGKKMDRDELAKHGVNSSMTHVDFMVGSQDMDIDGILEDGTREPVFRSGDWAF